MRVQLAAALLFATSSALATAQPASSAGVGTSDDASTTTLHVSTRLVVLDAVVVDRAGNVVTDLQPSNFHVTEEGAAQTIRSFSAPGTFALQPGVTIHSTAELDSRARQAPVNIIVLDEINTRFEDMAFAHYSLKKWLDAQPDVLPTPAMLSFVKMDHFSVLKDYTQDKAALLSALNHHLAEYPWEEQMGIRLEDRYVETFKTLSEVAEASAGHAGHKNVIWVGRGLPSVPNDQFALDNNLMVTGMVQRVVNELRDARVTLYAIDPEGLTALPSKYGESGYLPSLLGGDPRFEDVALATGGRVFHGQNDVDTQIGTAIRDGSAMYTFSYQPSEQPQDPAKFRRIRVTVDRPGLQIFTRDGYFLAMAPARLAEGKEVSGVLAGEMMMASQSNMPYDAVHFTVTASAGDPNKYKLHFDPGTIGWFHRPGSDTRWMTAIIMATQLDRNGNIVGQNLSKVTVAAPAESVRADGRIAYAVDETYDLKPVAKAARARVVVRMEATGRMGSVDFVPGGDVLVSSQGDMAGRQTASSTHP